MDWTWEINARVGLGPLRFGMSRDDVARVPGLGPVTAAHPAIDGSLNEFRTMDVPVCSYANDRLLSIDTGWRVARVMFEGLDVYATESRALLQALERRNGFALAGVGSVLFPEIGVNTGGFFDLDDRTYLGLASGEQDKRGLSVFRPGAFDAHLALFSPITFF